MRRLASFFCVLASIALLAAIFIVSVQLVVMDRSFYALEYQKMDTARRLGVNQSALEEVTDELLQYLEGKEVDLSATSIRVRGERQRVFSRDDVAHMVDVQDLYDGARTVRNVALLFVMFVLLVTLLVVRRDRGGLYARAYLTGFSIVGALLLVLGVWIQIDFDMFWNAFHHLFFRNLLWQMDPATSFMINMFPGQFWYDICMRVLTYFGIAAGALLITSIVVVFVKRHRRNTPMYLADQKREASKREGNPEKESGREYSAPWQNR